MTGKERQRKQAGRKERNGDSGRGGLEVKRHHLLLAMAHNFFGCGFHSADSPSSQMAHRTAFFTPSIVLLITLHADCILNPTPPSLPCSLNPRPCWCCLLVGCLTSQQQACVSQGRICTDNFTCCHTEIEVADPTFYLTQSQYTDTQSTSPSADPIMPDAWQGSQWSSSF